MTLKSILSDLRRTCRASVCLVVVALQTTVFYVTPVVNGIYDGWPRGWLVLSLSILVALVRGIGPGLAALATGVLLIWWRGTYFVPMHPGLEVFAALGLTQILVIHRLQLTQRELQERQQALEEERNRATHLVDVAERANRAKDEFLAVLSHELRTPLNVILGYSQMQRGPMATPDFVRRTSEIIENNALAQLRIVEDLLDVQRTQGGVTIERKTCDLGALAESVMESLRPLADTKGLHWAARVPPMTIEADPARLQQALWNVLSNAIKFTPEGGCVGMSGLRDDSHAVIVVEDSGEGIPSDFLPHLFEPFQQLDMSSTRRHGGLGLGLAIARRIVEAHGGSIAADSAGAGARFTLRLPIHDADAGRERGTVS